MPNSMALVGEYAPKRLRVITMMIVSNGLPLARRWEDPSQLDDSAFRLAIHFLLRWRASSGRRLGYAVHASRIAAISGARGNLPIK